MSRLWILYLVPEIRFGRWWSATGLFVLLAGGLWSSGVMSASIRDGFTWPIALFFCVIIAYITPVFHFITQRTEEALDELAPRLSLSAERIAQLRAGISRKSVGWLLANTALGFGFWLLQSRLLTGSGEAMLYMLSTSIEHFVTAVTPLLVWVVMTCVVHALVDNARLFRNLARRVEVDLLDPEGVAPFGRMAVSSTLVVIGSQASFSIMWLDGETNVWTTVPGMIPTTVALVFLFLAPVYPLHKALKAAKRQEMQRVQELINAQRAQGSADHTALGPLLAYRREVMSTHEWPFDLSLVARLTLYLVIVPLTWIGAALIENAVDDFLTEEPVEVSQAGSDCARDPVRPAELCGLGPA